jgi:hypothetical protein
MLKETAGRKHSMTYKELLFKMADKGMLTLSTQKDGRGLFWAGMDNMETLEQPFDWGDFEHKYSKKEIDGMRETLAESEWEGLKEKDLKRITWEGCDGWKDVTDGDVIDLYENIYGETDNVEIVQDKNINSEQGEVVAKFNDIK